MAAPAAQALELVEVGLRGEALAQEVVVVGLDGGVLMQMISSELIKVMGRSREVDRSHTTPTEWLIFIHIL